MTEHSRLVSIIEYAQHTARMRAAPASDVAAHGRFALWEDEARKPGVSLNPDAAAEDDDRWLVIERLRESAPPAADRALVPWLELTQSPNKPPVLKQSILGRDLIAAGAREEQGSVTAAVAGAEIEPAMVVELHAFVNADAVRTAFSEYLRKWTAWAEQERSVRQTIALYSKLFTLKQQFEEGIVEQALELVWGIGIGSWNPGGTKVRYPLLTRLVDLNLDETSGAIEIRPRDLPPRLELDWYASEDNLGVVPFENVAKQFFQQAAVTLSPFDRGSFEPLLRSAATHLDPNGVYRPDQVLPEDRSVPSGGSTLVVTDSWVLFARPRSNNLFIQDLERFKDSVTDDELIALPGAVRAIVTDPSSTNLEIELPEFRGVSVGAGSGVASSASRSAKPNDLFFPKPFNDEQVRIAQLLEVSDGVVVQGPPGTGKTHTIANVISHYLANGKRVLVTSMKDPALTVLRDQLPEDIRALAISLLSTEHDGMKQFEFAIQKIASEVQSLDKSSMAREIEDISSKIDLLHGQRARLDTEVARWAKANLDPIEIDGMRINPQDAAREIASDAAQFGWLDDELGVSARFTPQFDDEDILRLRAARRKLGLDIRYLGALLPAHSDFPPLRDLLQAHEDLQQYEQLRSRIDGGAVAPLVDTSQESLGEAAKLLAAINRLDDARAVVARAGRAWTTRIHDDLVSQQRADLLSLLSSLGHELMRERDVARAFLKEPVELPSGFEADPELVRAVAKLAAGQRPFGVAGIIGKGALRGILKSVGVLGRRDLDDTDSWRHVEAYIAHRARLRQLAIRWNALAVEVGVDALPGSEPEHCALAVSQIETFEVLCSVVSAERSIGQLAAKLLPRLDAAQRVTSDPSASRQIADALHTHLTRHRLSSVWTVKERLDASLHGRSGSVVERIKAFLSSTLGNLDVDGLEMQEAWTALMQELARVQGVSNDLAVVQDVTDRIAQSGAPRWAAKCREPLNAATDSLLPDNWRMAWRLRRLSTHLDAIDAHQILKRLSMERSQCANDLARAYEQSVSKRTWLKLAQNALPSIRAALAAYLTAIQKIGKGTGKRAVRFRKDARDAASAANSAVPCWIMPHHRVSESMPAELGCFDLVVIDEASQSDLSALPALLRAKKVLIVGDDKQVSPEGVGLEEEKIRQLMTRFLADQVPLYRPQLSPAQSLYDLFKVVFSSTGVMLKEHFRCAPAIIEYSKREYYNHELRPLRLPRASERLDPPLIDVLVEDGYRSGDINRPEADFIVEEVEALLADPRMEKRTIGIVSLLGDKQAMHVWERLADRLGPEVMRRHHVACGDARTFQGKERDVMFLSMVAAPNDVGTALTRDAFAQRFNVAASRARDRMYLVRSVELDHLSEKDVLRRNLIGHFSKPFDQDPEAVADLRTRCDSPFEREVYDELTQRGFRVRPQVKVGAFRIDLVVEGTNDARLAVECDGDQYHGPDSWAHDMQRQRVLERAGWIFWRCFASAFVRRREEVVGDLLQTLHNLGIAPAVGDGAPRSVHCESRRIRSEARKRGEDLPLPVSGNDASAHQVFDEAAEDRAPSALRASSIQRRTTEAVEPLDAAAPRPAETNPSQGDPAIIEVLEQHRLRSVDHRGNGGALWIALNTEAGEAAKQLRSLGFKFKAGRGWWRK